MRVPPTVDNCWAPPHTAPLDEARPVARAPRRRRWLAVSALLATVSVGVLGWALRPRLGFDGNAGRIAAATRALRSSGPPVAGAGVDVRADEVLASVGDSTPPRAAASALRSDGTQNPDSVPPLQKTVRPRRPRRSARGAAVGPVVPASLRLDELPRAEPSTAGPPVQQPPSADAAPESVPDWGSAEDEGAAEPAGDEPAAGTRAPWQLRSADSARAAEQSGEITQAQRDDILAALRERRQFTRSRAIRAYRDGLIDHVELVARLRDIEREFAGAPPPARQ
jgi:hypothetical protein